MKNELTEELTKQAQERMNMLVQQQNLYGKLINWRDDKINDIKHKEKVLRGYFKINQFLQRSL
jgi:hypothetical protein